jgi:hypothetical protein
MDPWHNLPGQFALGGLILGAFALCAGGAYIYMKVSNRIVERRRGQ